MCGHVGHMLKGLISLVAVLTEWSWARSQSTARGLAYSFTNTYGHSLAVAWLDVWAREARRSWEALLKVPKILVSLPSSFGFSELWSHFQSFFFLDWLYFLALMFGSDFRSQFVFYSGAVTFSQIEPLLAAFFVWHHSGIAYCVLPLEALVLGTR